MSEQQTERQELDAPSGEGKDYKPGVYVEDTPAEEEVEGHWVDPRADADGYRTP